MAQVAIVMGSDSDAPIAEKTTTELEKLGIDYEQFVMSAHKNPTKVKDFATKAEGAGYQVIVALAGLAAHLPGVIASWTTLPVIGVPVAAGPLKGIDALLSICQMPSGVPVATMGIGKWGAKNAAVLAAQIVALNDDTVKANLKKYKDSLGK